MFLLMLDGLQPPFWRKIQQVLILVSTKMQQSNMDEKGLAPTTPRLALVPTDPTAAPQVFGGTTLVIESILQVA